MFGVVRAYLCGENQNGISDILYLEVNTRDLGAPLHRAVNMSERKGE